MLRHNRAVNFRLILQHWKVDRVPICAPIANKHLAKQG